jgi:hypothetical protein
MPQSKEEFDGVIESYKTLFLTVRETRETVSNLRNTVSSIPSFTRPLRIARQRLADALDSYTASVTISISKFETSIGS